MMCGFVFSTFKTIMEVIKHAEKKILRTIKIQQNYCVT